MTTSLLSLLRDDLGAAGFTVGGLERLWGASAAAALHRGQRVAARRALAARGTGDDLAALAALATLFVLGDPVAADRVRAALPTLGLAGAEELGLVVHAASDTHAAGDARVVAAVDLRPYGFVDARGAGEWWIVSDLGELALGGPLPEDHVLGIGGASTTLSGLMLQEPVDRALDLGTGCGIQAMHAARHARSVVATDISARALRFAALNAALNGIGNIEFRLGSLFEPVAGERFDHIVSNPPFVITPRGEGVPAYEYRDGGMVGDALVQAVVQGAGDHLAPGGVAQFLANWEYRLPRAADAGCTDAFDRVAQWLDRPGTAALDAWVIERDVQDAAEYAETWIRDGGTRPGTERYDTLLNAWLDDFDERGVERVGFGYVLLRRPGTGTCTLRRFERRLDTAGQNPAGLGAHVGACLAAHDTQVSLTDDALAAVRLTVAPDVTEERHAWPGDDDPTAMLLRQGGGFGRAIQAGTALVAFVGACDGELALGAIVAAIADLLEVDADALRAELLPMIRALLDDGFLSFSGE